MKERKLIYWKWNKLKKIINLKILPAGRIFSL